MHRLANMFDRNVAAMCAKERYFAPAFHAARNLLDNVLADNTGLHFPSGAIAGPHGCSCGNRACLHQVAWRIYNYADA